MNVILSGLQLFFQQLMTEQGHLLWKQKEQIINSLAISD